MINNTTTSFDNIFDKNELSTYDGIVYLSLNNKEKYEKKIIKSI